MRILPLIAYLVSVCLVFFGLLVLLSHIEPTDDVEPIEDTTPVLVAQYETVCANDKCVSSQVGNVSAFVNSLMDGTHYVVYSDSIYRLGSVVYVEPTRTNSVK